MVLYLNADSKNNVGYTPDTLIIEKAGKRLEYDIQGDDDFDIDRLNCRVKGDLFLKNELTDDYNELTSKNVEELLKALKDKASDIIIAIYPASFSTEDDELERYEKARTDELTNCEGLLCIKGQEVNFKFRCEFYG